LKMIEGTDGCVKTLFRIVDFLKARIDGLAILLADGWMVGWMDR
jgi:hypothetical protein